MMYSFTNRRRAKDAIMLICDQYPEDTGSVTAFVQSGVIYVDTADMVWLDKSTIFHYAEPVSGQRKLTDVFDITEVIEVYRGDGLRRFRV